MPRFHQTLLTDKLNDYLATHDRDLILEKGGHCHGLTLLWLLHMAQNKEENFFRLIQRIIELDDISKTDPEIEELIAKLHWTQDPSSVCPDICQMDIDAILEVSNTTKFSAVMDSRQLESVIEKLMLPDKMICLSSPNHTVGLYKRGDTYFIYNPNFKAPCAKGFKKIEDVKAVLLKILYQEIKLPTNIISLQVNIIEHPCVASSQKVNKMAVLKEVVTNAEQANMTDFLGVSGLRSACENHDLETLRYLLEKSASVNYAKKDGETVLILSAKLGYQDIVELLIEKGAKISLQDSNGSDALFHALTLKHFKVAEVLLRNGANPLQLGKNKMSTFEFFMIKQNWEVCRLLYPYIKNFPALSEENMRLFEQHVAKRNQEAKLDPLSSQNQTRFFRQKRKLSRVTLSESKENKELKEPAEKVVDEGSKRTRTTGFFRSKRSLPEGIADRRESSSKKFAPEEIIETKDLLFKKFALR